jgi:hypothetical protein
MSFVTQHNTTNDDVLTAVLVTIQGVSHGAFPSLTSLQVLIAESMRTRPPSKLS